MPGLDDAVLLDEPVPLALGLLLDDDDGLLLLLPRLVPDDEPMVVLLPGLDEEALELPLFRHGVVLLPVPAAPALVLEGVPELLSVVDPVLAPELVPGLVELPDEVCACTAAEATARAALAARTASLWVLVMSEVLQDESGRTRSRPVPLARSPATGRGNAAVASLPWALPRMERQWACPAKRGARHGRRASRRAQAGGGPSKVTWTGRSPPLRCSSIHLRANSATVFSASGRCAPR